MDTLLPETQADWVLSFQSPAAADLTHGVQWVGGKGVNLARLSQAGFPVPDGFLITTRAYSQFVAENKLEEQILAALPPDAHDPELLEAASQSIRSAFSAGRLPDEQADRILAAYRALAAGLVAVRSSATAEDLPDMSFAGQQDTFLNVLGPEALLKAVVDCWSSLWTARAIGYRIRNNVPHRNAALAVVVQNMIPSQASGVLFTANPLSGLRTETVIDAVLGLGEALVSGRSEPDHYVVEPTKDLITAKTLGAKALAIVGLPGGGTLETSAENRAQQALPDEVILELAQMGQAVERLYGTPQDIEFAWADGRLALLQSRAITSLFPPLEGVNPEPLKVYFSFAAVQGLLAPITPLGRDVLRLLFATGAGLYGIRVTAQTQTVLFTAGERLWVNVTTLLRNSVGRRVLHGALGFIEPSALQALQTVWDDPRLQPERRGIRPKAFLQLARFLLPMGRNFILNLISPNERRMKIVAGSEQLLTKMHVLSASIDGDLHSRLARQARLLPEVTRNHLAPTFVRFVSGVVAGIGAFNIMRKLAESLPERDANGQVTNWRDVAYEVTRGVPFNPTTEMDLALWDCAKAIRADAETFRLFNASQPAELGARYAEGKLPAGIQTIIGAFIERYGARGLGEIDMGRERWLEEPVHLFEVLDGYLKIDDPALAPDVIFARGAVYAQAAVERIVAALRRTPFGWLKARLAGFMATRARALMGMRESPKFFVVRMMGIVRFALLKTGAELVRNGELDCADDLFFLTLAEIEEFAEGADRDWRVLIANRRAVHQREFMRRQIPRLLLSDGRAFYEGMRAPDGEGQGLSGSPVSPGTVSGPVRLVFDPRQANLQPGEILVCPGTDPSWTPLFLTAGGLIMEVGGMMTHGAVVAREYGIPAIVGVDQAMERLKTGQRIRMDGSTGWIELLEDEGAV